jgi:hypothetical protein
VLIAVEFDDDLAIMAHEVEHVAIERRLAAKVEAERAHLLEAIPKLALELIRTIPKRPRTSDHAPRRPMRRSVEFLLHREPLSVSENVGTALRRECAAGSAFAGVRKF